MLQLPGPGTAPTDWLPDYLPCPRWATYRPRSPSPGTEAKGRRQGGRPRGGKHTEKRREQWRRAKQNNQMRSA